MARRGVVTDGPRVAKFWETYCRHVAGYRGPLVAEPWQQQFLDLAFEVGKNGKRVFREVMLGIPRGNGKSTTCAGIGLYLLLADNEPGPVILSAAGKKEQAREVHGVAVAMSKSNPMLDELVNTENKDEIRSPENNGRWGLITSSGELEQGSNPHGAIVDETHVHKDASIYNAVFSGAIAKREQPMIASITTAGRDKRSFGGTMYDRMLHAPVIERPNPYLQIALDRDNGYMMVWYGVPDDMLDTVDMDDPAVWLACNPAAHVTADKLKAARNSPSMSEDMFMRFHLNGWKAGQGTQGIPPQLWKACEVPGIEIPMGAEVVIGVDGGYRHDWTAVIVAARVGDRIVLESHMTAPTDTEDVDLEEAVTNTILRLRDRYRIRKVVGDRALVMFALQQLQKAGLDVEEYGQDFKAKERGSLSFWLAVQSGEIAHAGNENLTDHILNGRMIDTRDGTAWVFGKPLVDGTRKVDNDKKIDGLVAAYMAVDVISEGPSSLAAHGLFI